MQIEAPIAKRREKLLARVRPTLGLCLTLAACAPDPGASNGTAADDGQSLEAAGIRRTGARKAKASPQTDSGAAETQSVTSPPQMDSGAVDAQSATPPAAAEPWRPFSADSPWNTKIPAGAELDADNPAMIADFATSAPNGTTIYINMSQWTVPLYWADANTPKVPVRADIGGLGFASGDGFNATAMVPVPAGATADPMSDGHMLVIDRSTMTEWGFFRGRPEGSAWGCTLCAAMSLTGNGVRPFKPTSATWYTSHGPRACGFPLVAGLLRPEAVRSGRIDHALVIAYRHIRAGLYTSPASTAQSRIGDQAIKPRGIPCGGRVQLDPGLDLEGLGLSPGARAVARALQEYGAYVGDYSDGITLYAESSPAARAQWSGLLSEGDLARIELQRFRVLKLGALTDDGNGD